MKPEIIKKARFISKIFILLSYMQLASQISPPVPAKTTDHSKVVIGYVPQWDAWKNEAVGVPAKSLNHWNIDYSQYNILNFSFFGVAKDGSLHSADFKNKQIYATGQVQEPAAMLYEDATSSHDPAFILGLPKIFWGWDAQLTALGYTQENWVGWKRTATGETGVWPLTEYIEKSMVRIAQENGVKALAAIGGWSMCKHFPEMAADATKRAKFIADCVTLVTKYKFDGIDLDWEYPGYEGMNFVGTTADFKNYTTLVTELRTAIGPNKLITGCFSAAPNKLSDFEWAKINQKMDYFNMMTYDFNGGWSTKAGHNSPLYDYPEADYQDFSVDAIYRKMKTVGVPISKVNLGVGFYGRAVTTATAPVLGGTTVKSLQTFAIDGPVSSAADLVNFSAMEGTPYYFQILSLLNTGNWTKKWDAVAKVPYLLQKNGKSFLSYDDEQSIAQKAQYVIDKQVGGVIIWEVFSDFVISGAPGTSKGIYPTYPNTRVPLANKLNEVFKQNYTGSPCSNPNTPAYSAAKTYEGGDIVIYNNVAYESKQTNAGVTPTNANAWLALSCTTLGVQEFHYVTKEAINFDLSSLQGVTSVEIYNLLGQKVEVMKGSEMVDKKISKSTNNLSKGVYIYRINSSSKPISGKFIKE